MFHRSSPLCLAALSLAACLAVSPVFAQGMGGGGKRFDDIDTNGDDLISSEEHAAWNESVFAAMDADGSGDLTEAEYMSVRMGPGPRAGTPGPRHDERQAAKRDRFKKMDADGDGTVSKELFLAYGIKRFEEADADKSGSLTFEEFRDEHRRI